MTHLFSSSQVVSVFVLSVCAGENDMGGQRSRALSIQHLGITLGILGSILFSDPVFASVKTAV